MPNTSATGGFLLPNSNPEVLDGELLQNIIHDWITGITGLAPDLVRPRWQPEPANIPDFGINWCAFGIVRRENDPFSSQQHVGTGDGYDEIRRHQLCHCLVSFYGTDADTSLLLFQEGMQIAQNRDLLTANEMNLVGSEEPITVPEFIKERWLYRVDLPFTLRRRIILRYPILNLLSAEVDINNEHYTENVLITN